MIVNKILFLPLLALLVIGHQSVVLAANISLYLDGSVAERSETAVKGYLSFVMPGRVSPNSLRIRPKEGTEIIRVTTLPQKPAKNVEKELATISSREEQLADRMKALAVREEIFKLAAKSQSAKAPRRTKTNPEPLSTIRQGTDYAITQLEAVYQARRKTEKELAQLAERRKKLQNDAEGGGALVRVWVKPANGAVSVSWAIADCSWAPLYDVRVNNDSVALISVFPGRVEPAKEEKITLYPDQLQNAATGYVYQGNNVPLFKESFKINSLQGGTLQAPLTVRLDNPAGRILPAGDASCYRDGVYMGQGRLRSAEPGTGINITCSGI